jgi:uncharacterized protein YjbI with pentapeptide repeats
LSIGCKLGNAPDTEARAMTMARSPQKAKPILSKKDLAIARKIAWLMPNKKHIELFLSPDDEWHSGWIGWRRRNPDIVPKLSGMKTPNQSLQDIELQDAVLCDANFRHCDLFKADFSRADCNNVTFRNARLMHSSFLDADLSMADLTHCDASNVDFRGANFYGATLNQANLTEADCRGAKKMNEAYLRGAIFTRSNLSGVDLRGADLDNCVLVETDLSNSDLTGARVYGISAWDVKTEGTVQKDLVITPASEPELVVDNLEFAQFTYLLLNNRKIRTLIDTITSKVVLILGRFSPERKKTLDAIREELRKHGYLPVLFDFEKPSRRDVTETVSTLAHMAKFVIADITDPRSIPQELQAIVPQLPSVPVQPILLTSRDEYGMFEHFPRYPWVRPTLRYESDEALLASLNESIINPRGDLRLQQPPPTNKHKSRSPAKRRLREG